MRKILIFLLLILSLTIFSRNLLFIGDKFIDKNLELKNENYVLDVLNKNIDEDDEIEKIILIGEKSSKTDIYSDNLKLIIYNDKNINIIENIINGGYDSEINIYNEKESNPKIIIKNYTGGSGNYQNVSIIDLKSKKIIFDSNINRFNIKGYFLNDFKISLSMNEFNFIIDLNNKKTKYINENLYDKNGTLINQNTSLMIGGISQINTLNFNRSIINISCGVSGFYHADRIGYLNIMMKYSNNDWEILSISFDKILYSK
ncbi:hypothetical protein OF820_05940 [Oceanotoga sp. DSM 15011]|uniref:hypothetical protein n=1 Tax=Oceanotoga sp. DSM 15011 TaxID=2984951 RepID=UPI0021F4A0AF|nr:hypothetical protein [Oceanotoga sp. DSM 15011]UYP01227.1 hypothetical protein OF820_05940 [Oceanotoga sp. DSM 15011]